MREAKVNKHTKVQVSLFTNSPSDSIFTAQSLKFPDVTNTKSTKANNDSFLLSKNSIFVEKPNDASFQLNDYEVNFI
jgi:hypothetical protein